MCQRKLLLTDLKYIQSTFGFSNLFIFPLKEHYSKCISPKWCLLQSNVLDRAVDWIFSHLDDLESMDVSEGGRSAAESEGGRDPPPGPRVRDGPGSKFITEQSLPQNLF